MKYILVREPFSTNCSGSHQKKSWIPWSSQRMTDCVGTHELIATQPLYRVNCYECRQHTSILMLT